MKVTDQDNLKEFHRVWSYGRTTMTFSECANWNIGPRQRGWCSLPRQVGQFESKCCPKKLDWVAQANLLFFLLCYRWWVPGTTRPRRLLTLWPLPEYQRVIGFSFQLAIIQHQFALHALGYCHLCKDGEGASRGRPCFAFLGVVLIGVAWLWAHARGFTHAGRKKSCALFRIVLILIWWCALVRATNTCKAHCEASPR